MKGSGVRLPCRLWLATDAAMSGDGMEWERFSDDGSARVFVAVLPD
jgi:hypothetical protein